MNFFDRQEARERRASKRERAREQYPQAIDDFKNGASRLGHSVADLIDDFRTTIDKGSVETGWGEKEAGGKKELVVTSRGVVTEEKVREEFEEKIDALKKQLDNALKLALLAEKGGESIADHAEENP